MKKINNALVDFLPIIIILFVAILCGVFIAVGKPTENGGRTLDGSNAKIDETTLDWIEGQREALARIMNQNAPTNETTIAENAKEGTGKGFSTTINDVLGRRLADGNNDNGAGWQAHIFGTLINLYSGGYKKVEELTVGDELISDNGELTKVTAVWESHHPVYKITTTQGNYFYTPEHPLGVNRGGEFSYIKTEDIQPGDRLVPRYDGTMARQTNLTDAELEFLGYWLGDGYIDQSKYTTAYNVVANDEKKDYVTSLLGDRVTWSKHSNGTAWVGHLKVSNGVTENSPLKKHTALTDALEKCGKYSFGKRVGFNLSLEERERVLDGYIHADGSEHHGGFTISTTSQELALWVQETAWMLGKGSKVSKIREVGYKTNFGAVKHDLYNVTVNKNFTQHDGGFKVLSVERISEDEPTIHIEVDGNHTYIAENIKVHNCSRYTAWLATGQWSYSSSHPDYGPVNGKDVAAWLVKYYGFKYVDQPVEGAIGSGGFNTFYGHTVMYLYATGSNTAMVNDANYVPLTVATHNMNIDGWVWVVPGNYDPTPAPTPTPTPTPASEVTYSYVPGDTFGQVLVRLGFDEGNLWGANGTVRYYTQQLIEQGALTEQGYVRLGFPFTLKRR